MCGKKQEKSFTLVELLLVIAIIGLLASLVLVSIMRVVAKGRDTQRKAELDGLRKAITLYYTSHGAMPINRNPGWGYCDDQPNFLQELVDDKLWPSNPKDPKSPTYKYCYYDYGSGGDTGALIVATLETYSGPALPGTCRPWAAGLNWCDQNDNGYYCFCNPY